MNRLKLNSLSRMGDSKSRIIFSAIVVAVSAFINVLPGVSDAFALITASSSGVYIAIYILTMLAHLGTVNRKNLCQMVLSCQPIKCWNPLTIVFFLFVFVCLFLQESTYIGAIGATIWIILLGFTAIGNIINKPQESGTEIGNSFRTRFRRPTSAQLSRAVKADEISVVEPTQPLRLARQSKIIERLGTFVPASLLFQS